MDQFRLVAATRQHMISLLGRDPNFAGLKLQHTLRLDTTDESTNLAAGPIFKNGTKAVFVGRAIYTNASGSFTPPTAIAMRTMENLCFLGENQIAYVDSLRQLGCSSLDQAHLLTSAGELVVLSVDDEDNAASTSNSNRPYATESSSPNNGTYSKTNIALITCIAILIPVSLLLLLLMFWLVRQQLNRINWEAKLTDKDPYWRTDHPLAQERLKVISGFEPEVLESSKCCISTDSSGSSATIIVEDPPRPSHPPNTPSGPRRRTNRLEIDDSSSDQDDDDDDDESAEIYSNSSITVHV
jgi:hypothetical protein